MQKGKIKMSVGVYYVQKFTIEGLSLLLTRWDLMSDKCKARYMLYGQPLTKEDLEHYFTRRTQEAVKKIDAVLKGDYSLL